MGASQNVRLSQKPSTAKVNNVPILNVYDAMVLTGWCLPRPSFSMASSLVFRFAIFRFATVSTLWSFAPFDLEGFAGFD